MRSCVLQAQMLQSLHGARAVQFFFYYEPFCEFVSAISRDTDIMSQEVILHSSQNVKEST